MARLRMKYLYFRRYQCVLLFVASLGLLGLVLEYKKYGVKHNFSKADVEYFAKNIMITYTLIASKDPYETQFEAEIAMTNKADRIFPGHDWTIFFSQMYSVQLPYPSHLEDFETQNYGVRIFHWNGQLYSFQPTEDFGYLIPGATKKIRVLALHRGMAVTDTFPNWYIVFKGFPPHVISNTEDDPFKFVRLLNESYSLNLNKINTLTSRNRYENDMKNIGHATLPILPTPLSILSHKPHKFLNIQQNSLVIVCDDNIFEREARLLATAWNLTMVKRLPSKSFIHFGKREMDLESGKVFITEAYSLSVNVAQQAINVYAMSSAGAFYAVQTLFTLAGDTYKLPEINLIDAPRFGYRGLMLDIARNFHGKDTIKRYLDLMAMYKLNKLHLHLSDDEGWRLEIPGLEELTEIGGQRCHDPTETRCILPFLGPPLEKKSPGSGYLTVLDYKELLRYAIDRHIEIIPEIDLPGHSHAAIKAMEARFLKLYNTNLTAAQEYLLSDLKDSSAYYSVQKFKDNVVNPCLHSTYAFINKVVGALHDMHKNINPLKIFHLGGDEIPKSAWINSPICRVLHLHDDVRTLKEIFIVKVSDILGKYNLEVALWQDGFVANQIFVLPRSTFSEDRDIHAYIWNDIADVYQADKMAREGYRVILTGAEHLYFDHPYDVDSSEPGLTWAHKMLSTKDVYSFVPDDSFLDLPVDCNGSLFCPQRSIHMLEGIQGTLFGELVRTSDLLDYMLLPRVIALAERAWREAPWHKISDPMKKEEALESYWGEFATTVGYKELDRLDQLGFKYRVPTPGAIIKDNILYTSTEFPGLVVEMSRTGKSHWIIVHSGHTPVAPGEKINIRARSANGQRYSRTVTLLNR
ncbi:beta-hexosaminidase-like isoform X2 [Biomphalaria glabrata]|uniref:beta-N-acetylhexosaminidase n=1 Tax=Biomphalaria glabrata TaxID=6526 RepID=A0A9W3A782_BIOGL|nr:beta-hexosaminidase-like isoform X2 [Biomphalaria glabrata]